MKTFVLTAAAALSLAACASTGPSAYGPAYGSELGYSNTKIQSDRFRVSYTGKSANEAKDYALLRAAEITLAEGYTHFKVLRGDMYGNGAGGSPISSSIGVGIGNGGYRRGNRTNVGVGLGVGDLGRALKGERVTNSLEILLQNTGGSGGDVYDAKSVKQSIRPAKFTP